MNSSRERSDQKRAVSKAATGASKVAPSGASKVAPSAASKRKGGRLRQRFRDETHAAVLAAAEAVFAETGLHEASMGEIAKRAGVAVGTLYNHFADRESLLSAIVTQTKSQLLDEIDHELKLASHGNFTMQLVALLGALFRHVDQHRSLFRILMADERMGRNAHSNESARALYQRFDRIIRRGIKDGFLREQSIDLLPSLLMGAVRGVLMREVYGATSTETAAECVGPLVELFLHGARERAVHETRNK